MQDIITDQPAPRIPVQAIREKLGRLTSEPGGSRDGLPVRV